MGVSKSTVNVWENKGFIKGHNDNIGGKYYIIEEIKHLEPVKEMLLSSWNTEMQTKPLRRFNSIELFAGAGGLALGLEQAGFSHVLLNEFNHDACESLKYNRPNWNVLEKDIHDVSFKDYYGKVDLLSGGFPCQAFSYAGKQGGFSDTRGTLFFELARAVSEVKPRVMLCENVRGLISHDEGRTFETIKNTIKELGYTLFEPRVLKAIQYKVPQKRERLFLIAVRNDLADNSHFRWPDPYYRILTLKDAFFKGELYDTDVPISPGVKYPEKKRKVLDLVPMGGYWKDLPLEIQKEYLGGSFELEGGKTGMARRLSLDEPSLTLTCSPAQKQTERCHPTETRPLTIREYARIQTFPDNWSFRGAMTSQYKQIGNAVPVNLAAAVGRAVVRLLNKIETNS